MTDKQTPVEENLSSETSSIVQAGDLAAKLIAYREKAGFDLDQAAVEMHLSPSILRALEKENFANLPEPPYIRGYLRGYAKLVDKDPRDLIRTYEALRGAAPDDIAHHFAPSRSINKIAQPALSPTTVKFIAFGSIVLVLGLISTIPGVRNWASSTWTHFSAQTNPPEMPRPPSAMETFAARKAAEEKAAAEALAKLEAEQKAAAQATATAALTSPILASAAPATTAPNTTAPAPSEPEKTTDSTPTAANDTVTQKTDEQPADTAPPAQQDTPAPKTDSTLVTPDAVAETPVASNATAIASTAPTTATPPDPNAPTTAVVAPTTVIPADPNAAPADPNAAPAQPLAPIVGEATIKMEFSSEVWVQVKNAQKKTLFEALNVAGSTKEFKATPPLSFKVGNAPGAKIYINGQLYDTASVTKGSVARFKIE